MDSVANPYVAPASELNQGFAAGSRGFELAERGTRLVAVGIDGLLFSIPMLPGLAIGMYAATRAAIAAEAAALVDSPAGLKMLGGDELLFLLGATILLGFLCALAVAAYQWNLITRTGQTLGKKWTGIRIERLDGGRMTFGTGVVLRNWVAKLLGAVPYLGWAFAIIDCLYIFREDRRCLHDHIAGTRVVRVQR